ncbi:PQQ-binding-like beta-propeller repeat protein [Streptomyces sp. NBC_00083]|uniref:outer membrane protein assembly factor BamB family protein n=1 Tax=Streptomyces sp. NBC_00083 TaxID=2975647 RepID=UPI002251F345|nr:PQQ-binding-like beta-propeller repeat protein [Streptomyces sp. NBC_00083]MCX5381959.1 PQQ-like beta-propeller repeat protein [Streptomyces sp. NBC_00083]
MPAAPPTPPAQPPQMPPAAPQPGYGTPQPAPGYGYPQTAPGQPGYGYPQTAPGQPGYGYPQAGAQGGPYAQTQQGGYGYPGQPPYPGGPVPPQGDGGKNPFKGKPAVIVAAAVAALLVIGGGVYFATSGSDGGKKPVADTSHSAVPSGSASVDQGDGKGNGRGDGSDDLNSGAKAGDAKVWLHENDTPLPQGGADQYGPWALGDTVVKAMYKEIVGYAVADGKQKWSVPLDTPICGAAPKPTADGKVVLGVQENNTKDAKCNQLQLVDLATGKLGWKVQVQAEGLFDSMVSLDLAISGNTVAVSRMGGASGYSMTDGKKVFGNPKTGNCHPEAYAGGTKLIAVSSCTDPNNNDLDAPSSEVLQEVDPATGKAKWSFQYDKGWTVARVYSMDPLVVYATNRDKKASNISAFGPDGKLRSSVKTKSSLTANCVGLGIVERSLGGCWGVTADANTLYMATEGKDSGELGVGRSNEVVAFDLNSGAEKWHAAAPKGRTMEPLALENGKLTLYVEPGVEEAASIASLPLTGGTPQITMQSPTSAGSTERNFYDPAAAWVGGRFFLMNTMVKGPKGDNKDNSILSFGK